MKSTETKTIIFGKRVSKDVTCNTEGRKVIEFCQRNILEMLNGKYREDTKREYTFVNSLGKMLQNMN
jgi:hypothetical protein